MTSRRSGMSSRGLTRACLFRKLVEVKAEGALVVNVDDIFGIHTRTGGKGAVHLGHRQALRDKGPWRSELLLLGISHRAEQEGANA